MSFQCGPIGDIHILKGVGETERGRAMFIEAKRFSANQYFYGMQLSGGGVLALYRISVILDRVLALVFLCVGFNSVH